MKTKLFVVAMLLVLAGCATVTPVGMSAAPTTEHVLDSNYVLGQEGAAYVGQPVIRVKDYWVSTAKVPAMRASSGFAIDGGLLHFTVSVDESIPVVGTTVRDGVKHNVVRFPTAPAAALGFLITPDGRLEGSAIGAAGARMGFTFAIKPAATRFKPVVKEEVSQSAGFRNFEIVYSGATDDAINMLYREYTPQDLARPAYTQALVYPAGSDTIRFRDLLLRVIAADSQGIRYIVLEDGT